VLEDLAIAYPRDLLAAQVGHRLDFFRRRRPHAARPHRPCAAAWSTETRAITRARMLAFGLEEAGQSAEPSGSAGGRSSSSRAMLGAARGAHVMEMQGRQREGIA